MYETMLTVVITKIAAPIIIFGPPIAIVGMLAYVLCAALLTKTKR